MLLRFSVGPVEQTLDDFIRMIIEQQIATIVMLSFVYDPITSTYAVSRCIGYLLTLKTILSFSKNMHHISLIKPIVGLKQNSTSFRPVRFPSRIVILVDVYKSNQK